MKATAAVLNAPNEAFSLESVTVADPRAGEILVRIAAVGVCHTDLVVATGMMGNAFPSVLGHEGAGIVEKVGEGVTSVAPGDKVLLTFNSCGECPRCLEGEPAYCWNFVPLNMICAREDGSSRLSKDDGSAVSDNFFGQSSFASYAIANERNVLKVDADADLALLAPLGCGIQTGAGAVLRSLAARKGQSLVVLGGGAVGLSAAMGGVIAGCTPIVVVEPQANRRALALELGATDVIDPSAGDTADAIRAILPSGADLAVDTSGHAGALESAVATMAVRGKLALVGVPGAPDAMLSLPIMQWITIGGTVRGVIEGDSDIEKFLPELIAHAKAGRLPLEKLVKTYPFGEINQAIDDAHSGKCVKVVLTF